MSGKRAASTVEDAELRLELEDKIRYHVRTVPAFWALAALLPGCQAPPPSLHSCFGRYFLLVPPLECARSRCCEPPTTRFWLALAFAPHTVRS